MTINNSEYRAWYKHDVPPLKFEQYYDDDQAKLFFRMACDHEFAYPFEIPFIDDDFILEQCIGFKDTNGVKAFFGDTIKAVLVDVHGEQVVVTGTIIWNDFEICVETNVYHWPVASWCCVHSFEIIGNKHEGLFKKQGD